MANDPDVFLKAYPKKFKTEDIELDSGFAVAPADVEGSPSVAVAVAAISCSVPGLP